jgi:hypothetical protein
MPFSLMMYASKKTRDSEVAMPRPARLKRKSFFVDERALQRARKALGVKTDAEVVRLSVERIAEMEAFWQFMQESRRALRPGSIDAQ